MMIGAMKYEVVVEDLVRGEDTGNVRERDYETPNEKVKMGVKRKDMIGDAND